MIALSNLDKQLKQQENSNNLMNDLIERLQFSQKQYNTQKLLTLILIQNQHAINLCSLCPWQIRCSKYWKLSTTYHMATWNTWGNAAILLELFDSFTNPLFIEESLGNSIHPLSFAIHSSFSTMLLAFKMSECCAASPIERQIPVNDSGTSITSCTFVDIHFSYLRVWHLVFEAVAHD